MTRTLSRLTLALAFALLASSPAWAQVTFTQAQTLSSGTNADNYTYASHTVHAGKLITVTTYITDGAPSATYPTTTGHSLTWRSVHQIISGVHGIYMQCAVVGGSDSTGTINVSFAATSGTAFRGAGEVVEWGDADTSGNCEDVLLQKKTQSGNVTNTSTVTFDAYSSSANRPYVAFAKTIVGSGTTDWTETHDTNMGGDGVTAYFAWDNATDDTTGTVTWSDATSAAGAGLGVEVKAAAASSGGCGNMMGTGMSCGGFMQ